MRKAYSDLIKIPFRLSINILRILDYFKNLVRQKPNLHYICR